MISAVAPAPRGPLRRFVRSLSLRKRVAYLAENGEKQFVVNG